MTDFVRKGSVLVARDDARYKYMVEQRRNRKNTAEIENMKDELEAIKNLLGKMLNETNK